jgi:ABC-type transport system substrate-binding protein
MVTMILVGCGTSSEKTPGSEPTAPASGSTQSPGDAAAPVRSKTVVIGTSYQPTSMDPNQTNNWGNMVNAHFVFDSLIRTDHNSTGFKPGLASSWEISKDGTTWTFHLRDDVKFTNGDPLTADDVVYTVQRVIDSDVLVYKIFYCPTLIAAEKVDDYTVKVIFSEPFPENDAGNAFTNLFIINKKAHEELGDDLFNNQLMYGTGAWILDEWVDGQYTKFHKNPDYWDKANYDSYFDEVILQQIKEVSTAISAHVSGTLDVYAVGGGISPDNLVLYQGTEDKIDLIKYETNSNDYINFSFKEGSPWLDDNFRNAFSLAIDRQMIIDTIFSGYATLPVGASNPQMMDYDESLGNYKYDPELAKQLVADSSYDGREVSLMIMAGDANSQALALAIADMAKSVGINLVVDQEEFAVYAQKQGEGDYDSWMMAMSTTDGNPFRMYYERILDNYNKPDTFNWLKYSELEALVRESMGLKGMDSAKRAESGKRINKFIFENNVPFTRIVYRNLVQAQNKGITGIDYWLDGLLGYHHVDWDPSKG